MSTKSPILARSWTDDGHDVHHFRVPTPQKTVDTAMSIISSPETPPEPRPTRPEVARLLDAYTQGTTDLYDEFAALCAVRGWTLTVRGLGQSQVLVGIDGEGKQAATANRYPRRF